MSTNSLINSFGLLLNIIGTLLIAVSFGKNLAGANQKDKKGRLIFIASILHPYWFKWGILTLLVGVGFQIKRAKIF